MTLDAISELKQHPWAVGFSALALSLVALNNSPIWVGVEPFLADFLTLAALLLSLISWARQTSKPIEQARPLLLDSSGNQLKAERTPRTGRTIRTVTL